MSKLAKMHYGVMYRMMRSCLGKNQLVTAADAKMAATAVQQVYSAAAGFSGKDCTPEPEPDPMAPMAPTC